MDASYSAAVWAKGRVLLIHTMYIIGRLAGGGPQSEGSLPNFISRHFDVKQPSSQQGYLVIRSMRWHSYP